MADSTSFPPRMDEGPQLSVPESNYLKKKHDKKSVSKIQRDRRKHFQTFSSGSISNIKNFH